MNEIATRETETSPVSLIQQMVSSGTDPATLREMLAVRREWEADEARKQYFVAIAEFQARCPIIDKGDTAHNKQYARIDRIWRAVRPIIAELGLSVTWQTVTFDNDICHVEGELAHRSGHSVRLVRDVPVPAIIQGQNKTQQAGSAETYAKRYALCGALGIVTGEDDDGHSAGTVTEDIDTVTAEEAAEITRLLGLLPYPKAETEELLKWAKVSAVKDIPAKKYERAIKGLNDRITKANS